MKTPFKSFIVLLAATLLMVGCSGLGDVEKRIDLSIQKNCAGRFPCVIDVKDATPFAWEKMYVFKYTATQAEIEQAIGTKITGYRELRRKLIFTKAGVVVHSEDEPTNVEHPIKNEVVFAIPDSVSYKEYDQGVSFTVSSESGDAGPYYLLQPTK